MTCLTFEFVRTNLIVYLTCWSQHMISNKFVKTMFSKIPNRRGASVSYYQDMGGKMIQFEDKGQTLKTIAISYRAVEGEKDGLGVARFLPSKQATICSFFSFCTFIICFFYTTASSSSSLLYWHVQIKIPIVSQIWSHRQIGSMDDEYYYYDDYSQEYYQDYPLYRWTD